MNKKNQLIAGIILSGLFTAHGALAQSLTQNLISAEGLGSKAVQSADIAEASALSSESFSKLSQMKIDARGQDEISKTSVVKESAFRKTASLEPAAIHRKSPRSQYVPGYYDAPDPTGSEGFKNGFHNGWRSVMSFSDVSPNVLLLPKPAIVAVAAGSLLLSAVLLVPSLISGLAGGIVGALVGTSKNK